MHRTKTDVQNIWRERNLSLEAVDVVEWCGLKIPDAAAVIERKGKKLPTLGVVLALMNVGLLLLLDKLAFHHKMEQENLSLQETDAIQSP